MTQLSLSRRVAPIRHARRLQPHYRDPMAARRAPAARQEVRPAHAGAVALREIRGVVLARVPAAIGRAVQPDPMPANLVADGADGLGLVHARIVARNGG